MAKKGRRVPPQLQPWVEARKRYRLSHAHIQLARELGNESQDARQARQLPAGAVEGSVPVFIEDLYFKRCGKHRPERVLSIEDRVAEIDRRKKERRERKAARRAANAPGA